MCGKGEPGACLEADPEHGLLGRENLSAALETARGHGREVAARHLRSGQDVIFPQLVTVHDHEPDPALENVAVAAGATYVEVTLVLDEPEHRRRLRDKRPATEVEAHIQAALEDADSDIVDRIRGHLAEYLAQRPQTIRIDTTGIGEDASYGLLLDVLDAAAGRGELREPPA